MNCPKCNAPILEGYEFCGQCGQKINLNTISDPYKNRTHKDVTPACRGCGTSIGSDDQFCGECGTQVVVEVTKTQENSEATMEEAESAASSETLRYKSSWPLWKVMVSRLFVVAIAYICGFFGAGALSLMLQALDMKLNFITAFFCIITCAAIASLAALYINKLVVWLIGDWKIFYKSRSYLIVIGLGAAAFILLLFLFEADPYDAGLYFGPTVVVTIMVLQIIDRARTRKSRV